MFLFLVKQTLGTRFKFNRDYQFRECRATTNCFFDSELYILKIGMCLGNRSEGFKTNGFILKTGSNRYLKVPTSCSSQISLYLLSGCRNSLERWAYFESSSVLVLFFFLYLDSKLKIIAR